MADKRQSSYTIRTSDDLDHLMLAEDPNPAGDFSLPQRPTERVPVTDFVSYLSPAQTASVTATRGTIVACKAAGAMTVTAPANAAEGDSFGVMLMNNQIVNVDGNGFQVQVPNTVTYLSPIAIQDEGAIYGWTLADPDQSGLRWMVSGEANQPVAVQWSQQLVTPTESPYQGQPNRIVRYDPRTVTTESDLVITFPNPTSHPWIFTAGTPRVTFGVKEVYGSNNRIRLQSGDAGVVIENPRAIPATAGTTVDTGGSAEYLEWALSDNKDIWLLVTRAIREQQSAYAVWTGISSNGDVPAGNIRAAFNIKRIARTATGVYELYPDTDVPSGSGVLFSDANVSSPNLANDQFGQGYQMSVTYGVENTAKIVIQFGTRRKSGTWADSDFAATGDEMAVRVYGVA